MDFESLSVGISDVSECSNTIRRLSQVSEPKESTRVLDIH